MFKIAYPNTEREMIVEIGNGWLTWIPFAEGNADYQKYLAWLAEGNTPEEWSPES
jgi:hypothetical protein